MNPRSERMHNIVVMSKLEGRPLEYVSALRRSAERNSLPENEYPHVSLYAGSVRRVDDVAEVFSEVARQMRPFRIDAHGVSGWGERVVYMKVRRSARLASINMLLHQALSAKLQEADRYCVPWAWVPHVSVAICDSAAQFRRILPAVKWQSPGFSQVARDMRLVEHNPAWRMSLKAIAVVSL